jgi:glucokinase
VPGDHLIGVDLGGTKLAVARMAGGDLGDIARVPTPIEDGGEAILEQIVRLVGEVRSDSTVGVGVGVPSVVDWEAGCVVKSVNIPLAEIPLRDVLRERIGLPVWIDNDANLAALAEAHEGDELVTRDLVMLTVGTGVGGGLVLNGRPYRGSTGAAAELGHVLIGLDLGEEVADADEHFPQPGSLERLAAGRALDARARQLARRQPGGMLGQLALDHEVTGVDAVRMAQQGDAQSLAAVRLIARRLGIGIANMINTFDPEVVAIGGGVSAAGDLLLEPAREAAHAYTLPGVGRRTQIRLARYGPQAGLRGAALLAGLELEHERAKERQAP